MRVLIVEDDDALRMVWQEALVLAGHEVDAKDSTSAAMSALMTGTYDLIVLDLLVGDGNSLSLSHYIGYSHPDMRVMVITGSGFFPNGEVSAIAPGVDWFLRKPLSLRDFLAMVDHAERTAVTRTPPVGTSQAMAQNS